MMQPIKVDIPYETYKWSCVLGRLLLYLTVVTVMGSGLIAILLFPWMIGSVNWHALCRLDFRVLFRNRWKK